ncbi:hypothetical protein EVAR_43142_1 [Eumeta japonica]|uniref:Uncharacterized protein n=1 Tax=Eumeta variegata TaxID=151549 RepID=A0A4C1XS41_EUMVA|nr:hypothetical protein EVAR_43142_1 [Eumeta japonica]
MGITLSAYGIDYARAGSKQIESAAVTKVIIVVATRGYERYETVVGDHMFAATRRRSMRHGAGDERRSALTVVILKLSFLCNAVSKCRAIYSVFFYRTASLQYAKKFITCHGVSESNDSRLAGRVTTCRVACSRSHFVFVKSCSRRPLRRCRRRPVTAARK